MTNEERRKENEERKKKQKSNEFGWEHSINNEEGGRRKEV